MQQDDGSSVEEILESIKKVIARDNRETAAQTRQQREFDGLNEIAELIESEDSDEDSILELSDEEYVLSAESDNAPVDGLSDEDTDYNSEETGDDALLSDAVRDSMKNNLAALAMIAEPSAPPQVVRSGETSLEGLTRELLRPMLAEWLDQNLPQMVELMVKAEIKKIAGKRS